MNAKEDPGMWRARAKGETMGCLRCSASGVYALPKRLSNPAGFALHPETRHQNLRGQTQAPAILRQHRDSRARFAPTPSPMKLTRLKPLHVCDMSETAE
jgi:hypothetical protein